MIALPKESLTVTHLRKLHRQGASETAMVRVAGSLKDLRYLDKRYGITKPREDDEDKLPTLRQLTAAQMNASRRDPKFVSRAERTLAFVEGKI